MFLNKREGETTMCTRKKIKEGGGETSGIVWYSERTWVGDKEVFCGVQLKSIFFFCGECKVSFFFLLW